MQSSVELLRLSLIQDPADRMSSLVLAQSDVMSRSAPGQETTLHKPSSNSTQAGVRGRGRHGLTLGQTGSFVNYGY